MSSHSGSSGWFKQAEEIEKERRSGSISPPAPRTVRPKSTPEVNLVEPSKPELKVEPPSETVALPRPTPPKSTQVVVPERRSGSIPPPAMRTIEPRPSAGVKTLPTTNLTPLANPMSATLRGPGTFSFIPDGPGHRMVYARHRDGGGSIPQIIGSLTVAELRQLRAAVERYLGAVDVEPETVQ